MMKIDPKASRSDSFPVWLLQESMRHCGFLVDGRLLSRRVLYVDVSQVFPNT